MSLAGCWTISLTWLFTTVVQTNINNYAIAVLLSVEISAYKGDIPRNHILVRI